MHDARDAEDKRLLEAGDHRQLLENYFYLVEEWAFLRTRDRDAADEVTQAVMLHLAGELARGKPYNSPFRVIVWQRVRWKAVEYWRNRSGDAALGEWDPPADDDPLEHWMAEQDLRSLLAQLPDGQRAVAELIHIDGLSPKQAAERLGIAPNAVYQRLHNAHRKLAEKLGG
jgi:RNA polymerase sigma factor (sigma-70 family)